MSHLFDLVKDAFTGPPKESTRRVTSVGTWASGKTTALACLGLACETLSARDRHFKYWPDEKDSGIRQFWSDLRRGRFPPATTPGSYYESGFTLEWDGGFKGSTTVNIPFCETAGEDIQEMIGTFANNPYQAVSPDRAKEKQLFEYILKSDGFILIAPISRALMFGDKGLEDEPENLPIDPDVNLARIIDAIWKYRRKKKKIVGMAILLSKYDQIIYTAKTRDMDLRDPIGRRRFMDVYFPQTSANLKKFGMPVEYFPVFVQVETDDKGFPLKWPEEEVRMPDGSTKMMSPGHKIKVHQERRLPVYSEESYLNLIGWVKETFAN